MGVSGAAGGTRGGGERARLYLSAGNLHVCGNFV